MVFCCPVIFLEGGRRLPRRGVFVCVSFARHLTRQQCDSRGSEFSSCSIWRWHCSVARASFVQECTLLQRQISNDGMRCLSYFPPTADSASVTLTVVVGGVVERLFVDFFLCFNLNFLSTDERIRMTVTM